MEEKKKVAAAIAAVFQYISDEEKALILQEGLQACQASSIVPVSFWGITGRQSAMQMRNLMLMKAFHTK